MYILVLDVWSIVDLVELEEHRRKEETCRQMLKSSFIIACSQESADSSFLMVG